MYARNVTLHLKANSAPEFTRTLETDILPVMRKQNGFKDEITFVTENGKEALAISLWEKKENAEARSEEHTSELQSQSNLVCRLLLEKKNKPGRSHARADAPT